MKKIISILLVLVILISSLCPTSVFAAMENTNLDWTNTTNWIFNDGSSKNIGTNAGAVAYTGGSGVTVDRDTFAATRGTTLKLDSGGFYASLPLNTDPKTEYTLSFSYYTDKVGNVPENANPNIAGKTYANFNTGIFIPNHPAFEGVSSESSRVGFGYTMTYLNYYASNFQMNTPAGHLWTVDSEGKKTGFADQDGDGNADGDVRTFNAVDNYHGIEVGKWYTISFKFNSRNFKDIAFTLQKNGGANMWIDDIILEKSVEDDDDYFEKDDKWIMSLRGNSAANYDKRRNIAATRADGEYSSYHADGLPKPIATDSANGDGNCITTTYPSHAYNIPLSNLKKNSTYSIEFYYKVKATKGKDTDPAFEAMGVYSPKFMDEQLNAAASDETGISSLRFDNYTVGWAAVDRVMNGGLYRYRDDTLKKCAVSDNRYYSETTGYTYGDLKGRWIKEKIEFSVKDYNDLHLVIIPGSTNSILLDDFRLVKLENAFENPGAWSAIKNDNTVDTSLQPTVKRLTKNDSIVKTLEMSGSAGVYATKVTTKQNHYYSFSFDYYGTELGNVPDTPYWAIIESCGVAELKDGKLIRRNAFTDDPARIYTTYLSLSFEGNTIGKRLPSQVCLRETDANGNEKNNIRPDNWYTISFEFSSGNNDALEFYIDPLTSGTFNVANFQLEDLGAYTSADKLEENKNLYNSCGSIKYEEVDATNKDTTQGFRLPYIGSGIEFKVSGTDNVKAGFKLPAMSTFRDYSQTDIGSNEYSTKYHTLRMKVWVDGYAKDDVIINGQYETTKWFTVAEGLSSNEEHTIKLVRATEAALGDKLILMGVLSGNGNLVNVTKTDNKPYIEVYGDSISSGYGNIASGNYSNFNNDTSLYSYFDADGNKLPSSEGSEKSNLNVSEYDFEDGTKTYAYLAAQKLGADINVFSKSGLGITVYGRKAGEGVKTMAKWYPELQKNENADYVIINHITNDSGPNSEAGLTKDQLATKYVEFIQKVRADHAKAKIIVIYGMMGYGDSYTTGEEVVLQAVATAKKEVDSNVYALMLPKGGNGGAGHPDETEHIAASDLLTEFISGLGVIETQNSVGIRAQSGPKGQGIRVKNNISRSEIEGKKIVSYGAIAIRKGRMTVGVPLTFDTKDIAIGVAYNTNLTNFGGKFNKVVNPPTLREQTATDNIFSCVLINIPQRFYDDIYSVRSFAIDDAGNVYYGEVVEVSVFGVVYSILNKESASQNDKNTANSIVKEIIDAAKTDNEITTYAAWCTANGLTDKSTAA